MSTINALLKKRQKLEQQIAAAHRLEKRKVAIITLLEKHDLLDLTDAQLLSLLCQGAPRPAPDQTDGPGA